MRFPAFFKSVPSGTPFLVCWLAALGIGFGSLLIYSDAPGKALSPQAHWPSGATLRPSPTLPTLVMVAHPQCPCSRASMTELGILMSELHGKVKTYILFYKPSGFDAGWEKTTLWQKAGKIPGVTVISDTDGVEAQHFHATISGQVFLYNPDHDHTLAFSGGITPSRGHEGDNAGLDAIRNTVNHLFTKQQTTFAFGCPIFSLHSRGES